jgi:hypothetical protein
VVELMDDAEIKVVCKSVVGDLVNRVEREHAAAAAIAKTVDGIANQIIAEHWADVEYRERFLPNAAGRYIERVWSAAVPAAVAKQAAVLTAQRSRVRQLDRIG